MWGKIIACLALLYFAGMIIVPIIPYLRFKVETFKAEGKKKQPPYELL
jgi:hypothetical protein